MSTAKVERKKNGKVRSAGCRSGLSRVGVVRSGNKSFCKMQLTSLSICDHFRPLVKDSVLILSLPPVEAWRSNCRVLRKPDCSLKSKKPLWPASSLIQGRLLLRACPVFRNVFTCSCLRGSKKQIKVNQTKSNLFYFPHMEVPENQEVGKMCGNASRPIHGQGRQLIPRQAMLVRFGTLMVRIMVRIEHRECPMFIGLGTMVRIQGGYCAANTRLSDR